MGPIVWWNVETLIYQWLRSITPKKELSKFIKREFHPNYLLDIFGMALVVMPLVDPQNGFKRYCRRALCDPGEEPAESLGDPEEESAESLGDPGEEPAESLLGDPEEESAESLGDPGEEPAESLGDPDDESAESHCGDPDFMAKDYPVPESDFEPTRLSACVGDQTESDEVVQPALTVAIPCRDEYKPRDV